MTCAPRRCISPFAPVRNPPSFLKPTVTRPWREAIPEASASPLLSVMSRPRIAALLRLAAGRCGRQPLGVGAAAVAAGEVEPPAEAVGKKWL